MHHRCLSFAVAFLALTAAVVQAADPTTNRLPEVVVTATRLPGEEIPVAKLPANVTVRTAGQITEAPSFTLPDLLRQEVGLVPIDQAGLGQSGNLTLRGYGEKGGLLILVDGVRMNDAGESGKPFLWNSIPLENIERIEVIRGGASTTYGEGAIAGVLNIVTKKPADKPLALSLTGAGGNLGYYNVHTDARGKLEAFDYVLSGDRQEWTGWRKSSDYRGWTAMARPGFDTPAGRFSLGYYFHQDVTFMPDALTRDEFRDDPRQPGTYITHYTNTVHRGTLDYEKAFDTGWTILGKLYGQTYDTRILYLGPYPASQKIEQPNYGTTWQLSCHDDFAHRKNLFTVGIEAIQQDFRVDGDYGKLTADNWTLSVFAQDTWELVPRLGVTAGVRYDHREWDLYVNDGFNPVLDKRRYADAWSPKIGLTYEYAEQANAWLTLSRAYRLPTGNEIGSIGFFDGEPFYPNPEVDPIIANTIEIGTRVNRWALLGGSLTYYYSHVQDDVVYNRPAFPPKNENFDLNRQGVELALTSRPADWVDFYFTTAWADARFDGGAYDGNRLPLVGRWQLTGGANWRPVTGLQLTFETVRVTGQLPSNDLYNQFAENSYTVCNARARYTWRWLTVFASANNLFDERYETYPLSNGSTVRKYNPSPGVNWQTGATITF